MSRFLFHVENDGVQEAGSGMDLANPMAARLQALRICAQQLNDRPDEILEAGVLAVTVSNESGMPLMKLLVMALDDPGLARPRR